jgi:phosphatidylglycerophosphate synthase
MTDQRLAVGAMIMLNFTTLLGTSIFLFLFFRIRLPKLRPYLQFGFVFFWYMEIIQLLLVKMLVKLTRC